MDAEFVRVVDVIGIGHCVKEEVRTIETKDKSNDEGNGLFRGSTFIPECVLPLGAVTIIVQTIFICSKNNQRSPDAGSDIAMSSTTLSLSTNITRLANLPIKDCQYILTRLSCLEVLTVQWL